MRQIILDTETTGLSPKRMHRVIEIGCLEMIDRKLTGEKFHTYLQPYRFSDFGALKIHGITDEFLADKPRFGDIFLPLHDFIGNADIIAHNAQFDIGFLLNEFDLVGLKNVLVLNRIICTKLLAEQKFGSGGNRLDDLCARFGIDNSARVHHGAIVDCELLAEVYLRMTENDNM